MGSLLSSTMNTRYLPTGDEKYIRTDCPAALTDDEVEWLCGIGVRTVVDLRGYEEHEHRRCRLEDEPGFEYHHLPATIAPIMPGTEDAMAKVYVGMLDERMEEIIDILMNSEGKAMYFCSLGKDRTGVVSAIIMHRLGFSDREILDDYLETAGNLREFLEEYVRNHPQVDMHMHQPNEDYIIGVLDELRRRESAEKMN
ncbi:MAG: tyrosine-protein phosphatase [Oscillospiraceae bacterium]|nr:tyrosine-protein phosphatase [Oscillospiraceae bacterium]